MKTSDILEYIESRLKVTHHDGTEQNDAYWKLTHPDDKEDVKPRAIRLSGEAMQQFRKAGERLGYIKPTSAGKGMSETVEQIALSLTIILDALDTADTDDMPAGILKSGINPQTAEMLYKAVSIIKKEA